MPEIKKVRYTHDAIIDEILLDPGVSQGELAAKFGFTQSWMSIIVNSDAFQERLAERKGQLVDPAITASIEDRLESLAKRSLDRLLDRVESAVPLKPLELVAMAKLGVGNRADRPVAPPAAPGIFVLQLPAVAQNTQQWLAGSARPAPQGVEVLVENADGGFSPSAP